MVKKVYVPRHKWRLGKARIHPGYWRKKRPKGKKKKLGKVYKMREIRDSQGYFRGWKRVK